MSNKAFSSAKIRVLRRLPHLLPGKARLARMLLREERAQTDVQVESLSGDTFLVPHLSEPVAFHLLVDGIYEPDTMNWIVRHLNPGDVFVDVGANVGLFTVGAARKVGSTGKVVSIEPSPTVFPYLERNIALNRLSNVISVSVGLSDRNQNDVAFFQAPADHFGMGSLAPQFDQPPSSISVRTLDSLLAENCFEDVAVLKVDVEGHEASVFRGAQRLLRSANPPVVVFEFCDWAESRFPNSYAGEAQEILMDFGYDLWTLPGYGKTPSLKRAMVVGAAMLVARHRSRV